MIMEQPIFIGRKNELKQINRLMQRRRNIIISFFEYLLTQDVPFIVLSRGATREDLHPLGFLPLYANLVEVSNFKKCDSDCLVSYYVRMLKLTVKKMKEFTDEVFRLSLGNPEIIQRLCYLSKDVKYFQNGGLNLGLADLDRRIEEVIAK
jgi:hypothetical protein